MNAKFLLILTNLALVVLPNISSAQTAPDLGTAASYALFTGNGAINNVGATQVFGDLGNYVGAYNGFPPGIVIGQTHLLDTVAYQVREDVTAAYAELATNTCTTVLPTLMGNGQTLTTGVYCIGGQATMDGNLIFDGGGDTNAVFIIQIDGAFSTGVATTMLTINSASFANVYWRINGQVDLGMNSIYGGTIIATGDLNLATNAILEGRGLAVTGAINLDNNMIVNGAITSLPVTLVNFTATKNTDNALLKWTTANEQSSKSFIVERSNTAKSDTWETIATIPAAGNSVSQRQYTATDKNVTKGINYYRLRSTNTNGSYSLSNTAVVNFNDLSGTPVRMYPNPVKNNLTVTGATQGSNIFLMDMMGKTLHEQKANGSNTDEVVTAQLNAGTYIVKIVSADGTIVNTMLNKQ